MGFQTVVRGPVVRGPQVVREGIAGGPWPCIQIFFFFLSFGKKEINKITNLLFLILLLFATLLSCVHMNNNMQRTWAVLLNWSR